MSNTRTNRLEDIDLDALITARDTAHHCVLTLPQWSQIRALEGEYVDEFVYECCRLTCILYMHCVMSPLLPGCPGISQPLADLRILFATHQSRIADGKISAMIMWSLFAAVLAAFRSQHRGFFIQKLQGFVFRCNIKSLQQALSMCRTFMWADSACLQGAAVVWDFMGLLPEIVVNAEDEP